MKTECASQDNSKVEFFFLRPEKMLKNNRHSTVLLRRFYSNSSSSTASSSSMKIQNQVMRRAVLEGDWKEGPPSLKTRKARLGYNSPIGLQEVFPEALKIVQKDSEAHYAIAKEIEEKLQTAKGRKNIQKLKTQLNKQLVRAELHNPEVIYNHVIQKDDFNIPVFRYLAERDWNKYDMLLLMQRLESLHVIPDTLPTLEPRANVSLQFPGVVNKWVEPGKLLRTSVAAKRPVLKIQEFEKIAPGSLYTVLIVDPDTPDLMNDSFKTTLHWAASNIPLSNDNHSVDISKADELVGYLPPHPEKNSPTHRYCVWVFRQETENPDTNITRVNVDAEDLERDYFDIRYFVDKYGLDPVGAHVWRCDFDRSTDEVREKFGLGPGIVYSRVRRGTLRDDPRGE